MNEAGFNLIMLCINQYSIQELRITFNRVTDDLLSEVSGRTPGLPIVLTVHVAEPSDIVACHQLIRLRGVTEHCDEEEEERPGEGVVHGTRVHWAVAFKTGGAQDSHVVPLDQGKERRRREIIAEMYAFKTKDVKVVWDSVASFLQTST